MFLVIDRRLGMDNYVFIHTDPRNDGYQGEVMEGVQLDYDMNAIHSLPQGHPRPDPQLGRDPSNSADYKVFKSLEELRAANFEHIHFNTPFVVYSWPEYRKRYYPVPEEYAKSMTQDEWFDFLEEADSATKIRRSMNEPDELKRNSNREQVTEWIAKRHMGADGGISQVWFLPAGAPVDEIRLLEVSERFTGESPQVEPIDFGVDIHGTKYKLRVADVSVEHIRKIEAHIPRSLPNDWRIDGAVIWGRRGRQQ